MAAEIVTVFHVSSEFAHIHYKEAFVNVLTTNIHCLKVEHLKVEHVIYSALNSIIFQFLYNSSMEILIKSEYSHVNTCIYSLYSFVSYVHFPFL